MNYNNETTGKRLQRIFPLIRFLYIYIVSLCGLLTLNDLLSSRHWSLLVLFVTMVFSSNPYIALVEYSGLRAIIEKINPPTSSEKKEKSPATFTLWLLGVYTAIFGIANLQYTNTRETLEHRKDILAQQADTSDLDALKRYLEEIPELQNKNIPKKPSFLDLFITIQSFFEIKEKDTDIVNDLRNVVFRNRSRLFFETEVNLSKIDLSGLTLQGVKLRKIRLENAELSGIKFTIESELNEIILDGANLKNSTFQITTLNNVSLKGSTLDDTTFYHVEFRQCDFSEKSRLIHVTFEADSSFSSCDFTDAIFDRSVGSGFQVSNGKFSKASFKDVNFSRWTIDNWNTTTESDFSFTKFINANISHSDFNRTNFSHAKFINNTRIIESNFYGCNFSNAHIIGAELRESIFNNSTFRNADFTQSDLTYTSFENADLTGAILRDLRGSYGINLAGANLEGVDLRGTKIDLEMLRQVKTLYNAMLDPKVKAEIITKHPQLLDKP